MRIHPIAAVFLAAILCANSAFAYIDPGTGGMIAGSIWPFIVSIFVGIGAFIAGVYRNTIKSTFLRIFRKKKE